MPWTIFFKTNKFFRKLCCELILVIFKKEKVCLLSFKARVSILFLTNCLFFQTLFFIGLYLSKLIIQTYSWVILFKVVVVNMTICHSRVKLHEERELLRDKILRVGKVRRFSCYPWRSIVEDWVVNERIHHEWFTEIFMRLTKRDWLSFNLLNIMNFFLFLVTYFFFLTTFLNLFWYVLLFYLILINRETNFISFGFSLSVFFLFFIYSESSLLFVQFAELVDFLD